MITRVTVKHFKRFEDERFELGNCVVLAGPNNTGKTTLLQAIKTWKFGLDRWVQQRSGGGARERTGVPITRQEFSAIPLREMNLLWTERKVAVQKRDHPTLATVKASEDILRPLLAEVHNPLSKSELYLIAAKMTREDIHPEVCEKLDAIAEALLPPSGT